MNYLIVGFGNIGHRRAKVLGKNFIAAVDPNPKTEASYSKVQDVPIDLYDVAVLTIPQQDKYKLTKYFLNLGKHVLVEKPLILTKNQSKSLDKLAKKNKVIWHTSYNHRFEPNIVKLKKLIESNFLGKFYYGKFVYSFGNIKERLGTWRETRFGVLEEIIPHQLDFIINQLGYNGNNFKTLIARKVESDIFDHWLISTTDKKVTVECSAVTWKNIFSIDLYGEKGSLHIEGLRKWNGSKLTIRTRVLPSGVPKEKVIFDQGPDITWSKDFKYFEAQVKLNQTSLDLDNSISQAFTKIKDDAKKI